MEERIGIEEIQAGFEEWAKGRSSDMAILTEFSYDTFARYSYGDKKLALARAEKSFRIYWKNRNNSIARSRCKSCVPILRRLQNELSHANESTESNDVGFGPAVKVETICNKCGSVCEGKIHNYHGCSTCDAWVTDVRYKRIRMLSNITA